ncbi:MAG: hypothetical protein WAR57_06780 [Candidatus Phosphoribacter sp.]|nr:peptidase [Actinomycetales bacterium]
MAALTVTTQLVAPSGASLEARAATDGSIGLRILDVPANAGNDPRAKLYIVDHLAPGAVISRRIEVSNTTSDIVPVKLYSAAATIADGSFLGADGRTPNDLSTWTSVDPDAVDVPAGGLATATVTVAVPTDAPPGEQYGVVWAEASSLPVAAGGITQVSRVGIRLYVSVGSGNAPAANFTIDSLTAERSPEGQPTVRAAVHNTGGRALDLSGTLRLSRGPAGLSAGPFPADLGTTVAVGHTELVTIVLDPALPAGPWDAEITMRSGLLEHSAQATITFPVTGQAPPVNTTTSLPGWVYLVIGCMILMLCIAALLAVVTYRRRNSPSRTSG